MDDDILIVGADGLVGSMLARHATAQNIRWKGTSRRHQHESGPIIHLDLAQETSVASLSLSPRLVYLCAAVTQVRQCEDDFPVTHRINVEQTYRLAKNLAQCGAKLVFLSTSLVFDGNNPRVRSDTPPSPQTAYGRQKAELEKRLLDEFEQVAIVRLTKVVHSRFAHFQKWRTDLRAGLEIGPLSDLVFSPIDLSLVTDELLVLAKFFRPGIYQLSGDRDLTYLEAAQLLVKTWGLKASRIVPKTCAEAGLPKRGPQHTTLEYRGPGSRNGAPSVQATLENIFRKMNPDSDE